MDQVKDDRLRAYSVWVPILLTDAERAVPNATKRLADNRVSHSPGFWMHQLYSVDPKNAFDSKALAIEVQRFLK